MLYISATNKISNFSMTDGGGISQRDKFENNYNIRYKCKCPIINIGVLSKKIFFMSF